MKKLYSLILLLSSLLPVSISAQLHIAKDNIACAYGLKDETGNWVVQPGYTYMNNEPAGCFSAMVGEQMGVFSPEGKVIVPFSYSIHSIYIDQNEGLFIASDQNRKSYIYTSEGKKLFENAYDNIRRDGNLLILNTTRDDSIFSSCADFSGKMIFENVYGDVQVLHGNSFFTVTEYHADDNNQVGVIDSLGKQFIPRMYRSVEYIDGKFLVTTHDSKHGVIDQNKQFLLRPDYIVHFPNRYSSALVAGKMYVIEANSKFGLLEDYKVTLEPAYTSVHPIFPEHPDGKMFLWSNGKMGVYARGIIIPAIYDEFAFIGVPNQSEGFFYACRIGQKWGLLNEEGKLVLDMIYDSFDNENRPNMHYGMKPGICLFGKGKEMFAVDLSREKLHAEKMTNWSEGGDYKIFAYKSELYPFQLNFDKKWSYLHPGINFRVQLKLKERIFIGFGNDTKIFDLHGERLDQGNVAMLHDKILRCKDGRLGLIHKVTGRMLLDTAYRQIIPMFYQNLILACRYEKEEWIAFDTLGNQKVKTVFDYLPDLHFGIARAQGKYGLIDHELNWIVKPEYKNVVSIFDKRFYENREQLYYAETPAGTLVVLDQTGKSIVPEGYKELIPIFHSGYYDEESEELKSDLYPFWWVLRNGNRRLLFNNLKQVRVIEPDDVAANRFADSLMFNAAFVNDDDARYPDYATPEIQGKINVCNECFKIRYPDADGLFEKIPYKQEIYGIFREQYIASLPCLDYQSLKVEGGCAEKFYEWYSIASFGEKFVTTSVNRGYFQENYERNVITKKSYIWKDNHLQEVTLKDIFGTGAALREELVYAIQSGDYELDCSTPDKMIEQIGNDFILTSQGISLNLNNQGRVLIAVERLRVRKETRRFAKFLE